MCPTDLKDQGPSVTTVPVLRSTESMRARTLLLNKRPMGHIAHLRKQFKSINTYDYIITLIKGRKKHY